MFGCPNIALADGPPVKNRTVRGFGHPDVSLRRPSQKCYGIRTLFQRTALWLRTGWSTGSDIRTLVYWDQTKGVRVSEPRSSGRSA